MRFVTDDEDEDGGRETKKTYIATTTTIVVRSVSLQFGTRNEKKEEWALSWLKKKGINIINTGYTKNYILLQCS